MSLSNISQAQPLGMLSIETANSDHREVTFRDPTEVYTWHVWQILVAESAEDNAPLVAISAQRPDLLRAKNLWTRTTPDFKIFKGVCKVFKGFQGAVTWVHSCYSRNYNWFYGPSDSETAAPPQKLHCTTQKIISFDHAGHAWTIRFSSSTSGARPSMSSRRTCLSLWVGFETSGKKWRKVSVGKNDAKLSKEGIKFKQVGIWADSNNVLVDGKCKWEVTTTPFGPFGALVGWTASCLARDFHRRPWFHELSDVFPCSNLGLQARVHCCSNMSGPEAYVKYVQLSCGFSRAKDQLLSLYSSQQLSLSPAWQYSLCQS